MSAIGMYACMYVRRIVCEALISQQQKQKQEVFICAVVMFGKLLSLKWYEQVEQLCKATGV